MKEIRILTYNIHKGFTVGNRRFVLNQIREELRKLHPDLIFLQEVVGFNSRNLELVSGWPANTQSDFLAEEFWPYMTYGKNALYLYGHHGNALISRYPILRWKNLDVSTNVFESRGILHCLVSLPGGALHCFCTHLNLLSGGRRLQLDYLCRSVKELCEENDALVIAGDFNDWRCTATPYLLDSLQVREAHVDANGTHARTYPARLPVFSLDRIYSKGVSILECSALTGHPWNDLSDHLPIFCRIAIQS